ncbi:MAG: PL29 family lyase N-terminal domain-containing protein [Bacteroidales bacterium]|nr:PL29 family lyase N-terminal domain-containing protein [Bacteroidales bacterium]
MNKKNLKLVSAALLATLTMGTTFTGCKDYDDDINNLQEQITANKTAIEKINSLIASGSVITNVAKTANGVTVTLSNGNTFELTNGAAGAAGKDADVWTIVDGYWAKNGVKTEYKAVGEDGTPGAPGEPGLPGADGKDGAIYRPNTETGNFDIVTWDAEGNEVVEDSNISWKAAGLSAVLTGTDLVLSGVEGTEGTVTISLSSALRGFTFMPEYTKLGEPWMLYPIFKYSSLTAANQDSKTESWKQGSEYKNINNGMVAKYKVTPSNAKEADLKNLSYDIINPKDIMPKMIATKAESLIDAQFGSFANGELSVDVKFSDDFTKWVDNNLETDIITQIALQATVGDEVITSTQYVTVEPKTIGNFELANPKVKGNYHYRTAINTPQTEAGNQLAAWDGGPDSQDFTMVYGKTINLFDYVETHNPVSGDGGATCSAIDIEQFGLNYKFELVKNYTLGTPATDQADFIDDSDIANGNITSKVYSKEGIAAVGRTPIIRVKLMDGTKVVKVAYIKILITDKEVLPIDPIKITVADELAFDCAKDAKVAITVKQMNEEVYLAAGLSKAEFHKIYQTLEDKDQNDGIKAEQTEVPGDETTYVINFTMSKDDVWANSGKTIEHTVTYKGANVPDVVITFTINVEDITKTASVKTADMLKNIWAADYSYAKFNVAVPTTPTDANPDNCKFENDLNYPFVTENGIIKGFENITYAFAKENENSALVVGKYTVKVTLADDTLKAQILKVDGKAVTKASEVVATIKNTNAVGDVKGTNVVTYAGTETAKALLNTNAMFAYVGATTVKCAEDPAKVITIDFNGKDYFQANFIRPINVAGIATGEFIDAVDKGNVGSYVALEDLVALTDWRKLAFADNAHFYGFYGLDEKSINVNKENVKTTVNGDPILLSSTNTEFDVMTAADMKQAYPSEAAKFTSKYGYIVYYNGTATVNEAYTLTVPVTVTYKWGTTDEVEVTVNVVKTIGQAKKN